MGLFDKKICDICGEKIGLLGNWEVRTDILKQKHFLTVKIWKEYIYRILQMTLRMMRLMDVILW